MEGPYLREVDNYSPLSIRPRGVRQGLAAAMASNMRPLVQRDFRRIWSASLLSNLGQQMQAVTAAWLMVQLTNKPDTVALVQTATMLPVMLGALPAGAIADMFDRRKVAIAAMLITIAGAGLLLGFDLFGLAGPTMLLSCCFLVGIGVSMFVPAWQSSIPEQVDRQSMPAAVALYSISSNLARSVGPALGGAIVAWFGASIALVLNFLLYIPIILALTIWRRTPQPVILPRENIMSAMGSGLRYMRLSSPLRSILLRALMTATTGSVIYALLPLATLRIFHGNASTFGLLLGSFGCGAITAALSIGALLQRFHPEAITRVTSACHGVAILAFAYCGSVHLATLLLAVAGACWTMTIGTYNIGIQLGSPRWVAGRALATYAAVMGGGIACGAWLWSTIATRLDIASTIAIAAVLLILSPLLSLVARLPGVSTVDHSTSEARPSPQVQVNLTGRSGPIVIQIEHRVAEADITTFHGLAHDMIRIRERNGAYGSSLAQDVTDPTLWIEHFHFPTWDDYLRARARFTKEERSVHDALLALGGVAGYHRLRHMVDRPRSTFTKEPQPVDVSIQDST